MSGGHWNYRAEQLRANGDDLRRLFMTLAEVEEALDWGICGDWSMDEAKEVAARLLINFFDGNAPRRRWDVLKDVRAEEAEQAQQCRQVVSDQEIALAGEVNRLRTALQVTAAQLSQWSAVAAAAVRDES